MARLRLYRNISIVFILCAAAALCAVFLLFYSQATIIVSPDTQTVNLSFVTEIQTSSTPADAVKQDALAGKMILTQASVSRVFNASSTKAQASNLVGVVKLVNNNSKPQKLVKTTQLQAASGVIVRTNDPVEILAGGSVQVAVYPADPKTFQPITDGKLTIIKLWPQLQSKIYGEVVEPLSVSGGITSYIGEDDISRAQKELIAKAVSEAVTQSSSTSVAVKGELVSYSIDRKLGDAAKTFTMKAVIKLRVITVDQSQLSALIQRKAQKMDLSGMSAGNIDMSQVQYAIIDASNPDSIVVKVTYQLKTYLTESSDVLAKENFTDKTASDISAYAAKTGAIKQIKTEISPYWRDKTPSDQQRIKVIIE